MKSRLLLLFMLVALIACEDKFRYKCQDPRNWDNLDCKPPVCVATGTCPEQLVKPEAEKK